MGKQLAFAFVLVVLGTIVVQLDGREDENFEGKCEYSSPPDVLYVLWHYKALTLI